MDNSTNKLRSILSYENLVLFIYCLYVFSIIAFGDQGAYYRYSNIIFLVMIAFMGLYILKTGLVVPTVAFSFLPFVIFCFLSYLWSYMRDETQVRAITVLRVTILLIFLTIYLMRTNEAERYIKGFCFTGIPVVLYVVAFYGMDGLRRMMSEGERVGGDIVNVNTLGVYLAMCAVLMLLYFFRNRNILYLVLSIPLIAIIALTGSKKGILDLAVGLILVIGFSDTSESKLKKYAVIAIRVLVIALIVYFVWQLPIFDTVRSRIELMFGFLNGTSSQKDYSTMDRQKMIVEGLAQFRRTPFIGIGIGATGYITLNVFGVNTYLHNDYVELLASGGILGFLLYIIPIVKAYINGWRVKSKDSCTISAIILLTLFLVNGFASVQYFSKISYIIFGLSMSAVYTAFSRDTITYSYEEIT